MLAGSILMVIIAQSTVQIYRDRELSRTQINNTVDEPSAISQLALVSLSQLEVKGRAPSSDYKRSMFGSGWASIAGCDMRNRILARDLTETSTRSNCVVLSGVLVDPYTAKTIYFQRGESTSQLVQIDHVVALSDAWQKGAKQWDDTTRLNFANDPLNLLAVDGESNKTKSGSDAASWLPPFKNYRCRYIARQIAVKLKYRLSITEAERGTMSRILDNCPDQVLPIVQRSGV